jgi:hypothetical protein
VLGDNHRLRERLKEDGKRSDAQVLEAKERPWVTKRPGEIGAWATFRLKLQVAPPDEPAFVVEITDQWRATGEPQVGTKVPVLYDPQHQSHLVLDESPGRYALVDTSMMEDPELAQLAALDAAEQAAPAAPAGGSQARLDQLKQLADLHDRGVLNDVEFAAEKAKILAEG